MKPTNQIILNSMFGCTLAEQRWGLAQRSQHAIISKMINDEANLLAEADDYTYGDNTDREE
jgi:hypothetical protein